MQVRSESDHTSVRDQMVSASRNADRFRVILLTHGGAEETLRRLISIETVDVVGIFVETQGARQYTWRQKLERSVRYDGYTSTITKLLGRIVRGNRENDVESALKSQNELAAIAASVQIPFHAVENFHLPESISQMAATRPDLGVIYGTNIVKESVFKIPRLGSINLHQGLAPYYRGGPPVFWELYNGEMEVGLTVHYVESKVDSGAILVQETVPLRYDYRYGLDYESFIAEYRRQLNGRCADLVAQAVRLIATGTAVPKPQDTSIGKRYRLPIKIEKDELRRRLRQRQAQSEAVERQSKPSRSNETSRA